MFFPGSRYQNAGTYQVTGPNGSPVTATVLPLPTARTIAGWYPVVAGERLDLVAYQFLSDPTATWVLCDTNGSVVPDALAAHTTVAIPVSS
jgi:hypothetical protein